MPAKKKLLPRPCPCCGEWYGTISIVVFRKDIIIRIGHYSPVKYRKTKISIERNFQLENDQKQKSAKDKHSFS